MPPSISVVGIHHLALVVSNVQRSADFYQQVLGFKTIIDMGTRVITVNGNSILALTLPAGAWAAPENDRFDENRIGIDHVSFTVATLADLDAAVLLFDELGVPHGEIRSLAPGLPISVLAFRDPDNIQLELTAPND